MNQFNDVSREAKQNRIFIVGFMGTGKTYWGKIWAERHHMEFADLDAEIEASEQLSVTQIFEKRGEDYFRHKEAMMLRSFISKKNIIISCGGGTPCFFDNAKWMNQHGITVLLKASPAFILANILTQENKRPLVKHLNEAEMTFFIEQKLKERSEFYQQAALKIDAASASENNIDSIIKLT